MEWSLCKFDLNQDDSITGKYSISLRGSMAEYRYILDRPQKFHVVLYNGDWDDIIPFADTLSNLDKLKLDPSYLQYLSTYLAFPSQPMASMLAGPKSMEVCYLF